jgi:hypothetical protein
VPGHFVMLGRVLGALGGMLMHYKPKLDLLQLLLPYMIKAT